ncbi:hypothetical protein ABK040_012158 [Willaertia magna]
MKPLNEDSSQLVFVEENNNKTVHFEENINEIQQNNELQEIPLEYEGKIFRKEEEKVLIDEPIESNESIEDSTNVKLSFFNRIKQSIMLYKTETIELIKIAWPITVLQISNMVLGMEDLAIVGHIKSDEISSEEFLASAALGNSLFYCLSFMAIGLINGQETLVSQAFGAKNFRLMGIVLNRSLIITIGFLIPISIAMFFGNYILTLLQMIGHSTEFSPRVIELTIQFVRYLIPGLFPFAVFRGLSSFFISQSIMWPSIIISVVVMIVNLLLNLLLVFGIPNVWDGLGFIGAPIATSITRVLMLLSYVALVAFFLRKQWKDTWHGFLWREVFQWEGVKEFLKFAIPSSIMLCAEIFGFEIATIISAFLGPVYLSAHGILLNITNFTFMFPLSISSATTVRVGQEIGEGDAEAAKKTALSSTVISSIILIMSGTILAITMNLVTRVYTNDENVVLATTTVLPLCIIFQFVDGLQAIFGGILRGVGKQTMGAVANLVGYYVIGLPLGSVMAFVFGWKLMGLWLGLTIALTIVSIWLFIYYMWKVNWKQEAMLACEKYGQPTQEATELDDIEAPKEIKEEEENASSPVETVEDDTNIDTKETSTHSTS